MSGNPATPAFFPLGVILELEVESLLLPVLLTALLGAVSEMLLETVLPATGEGSGELSRSTTATAAVADGAIEAVELGETAPGGPLWFHWYW